MTSNDSQVDLGLVVARLPVLLAPPLAVVLVHAIASLGFQLYEHYPPLDIPMHAAGGIAIAFMFCGLVRLIEDLGLLRFGHESIRLLFLASLLTSSAVGWEFVEFVSDRVLDTGAQVGLEDTLLDMFLGIVGGLCCIGVVRVRGRGKWRRAGGDADTA